MRTLIPCEVHLRLALVLLDILYKLWVIDLRYDLLQLLKLLTVVPLHCDQVLLGQ